MISGDDTLSHIAGLASLRSDGGLIEDEAIELYDSIDSLPLEELSELYAIARVGETKNRDLYAEFLKEAREVGYALVDQLYATNALGEFLQEGLALLQCKDTN